MFKTKEKPALNREECKKRNWHGGAGIKLPEATYCLTCHTIVTEKDIEERIEANGGRGHWLGCVLDKYHEGDCLVRRWKE